MEYIGNDYINQTIDEKYITGDADDYEKFKALHDIVCHTYFLRDSYFNSSVKPYSYFKFRKYFRSS